MIILGAGLSGLLAGALDRRAHLLERQTSLPHNHSAVLRFREPKIGAALNIPFRRVRVLKDICVEGRVGIPLTPSVANWYARKVTGAVVDRSILNLAPSERFIAPPDLVGQLAELCAGRIDLGHQVNDEMINDSMKGLKRPIISTIPLPRMLEMINGRINISMAVQFASAPIHVIKHAVPGADVFQTVYFPHPKQPVYRATITGSELAIEITEGQLLNDEHVTEVLGAFGLGPRDTTLIEGVRQGMGKILPLPDMERKALLLQLTVGHGIYSLGRYATWRNILLDDVYEDFFRVRKMMALGQYDLTRGIVS